MGNVNTQYLEVSVKNQETHDLFQVLKSLGCLWPEERCVEKEKKNQNHHWDAS